MRRPCLSAFGLLLSVTLALGLSTFLAGQEGTHVNVGTMLKYSGPGGTPDSLRSAEFLKVLEAQLAAAMAKSPEVDYLERTNLEQLFRELHVTSSGAFDFSSGGLRGLMGRLDFLVVAEASSSSSARVRLIDVETGAVKFVTLCEPKTTLFGGLSNEAPSCIQPLVSQTAIVAKARSEQKKQRLEKATAAAQAAQQEAERQAQAARDEQRKRLQQEQQAAQQREKAEREAQAQQAALHRQIENLTPQYEDALGQLEGQTSFWQQMSAQLRSRGGNLRPEIQSTLSSATATANRCHQSLIAENPQGLNSCLNDLRRQLDKLETYK